MSVHLHVPSGTGWTVGIQGLGRTEGTSCVCPSISSGTVDQDGQYRAIRSYKGCKGLVGLNGHPVSVHPFPVVQWDGINTVRRDGQYSRTR